MSKSVWTIMEILNWTKQHFAAKGVENPRLDAEVLLCAVLKCQRIKLYTEFDKPLSEDERQLMRSFVERRAKHEPLAYIVGERAFMRNSFKVTPATLVPRPETELLVESLVQASKLLKADGAVKILDIGTGSGAILVSLLDYLPAAVGVGVDISNAALAVAKENAANIGVDKRAAFRHSDVFSNVPLEKKFDIIVSNPPYIPAADIATLDKDVQQEPHSALDGGADGLDFYRRIAREAAAHLADDGLLTFEIGINQSEAVQRLCLTNGFKQVAVRNDYADIPRMVFALKEKEGEDKYGDILLEITKKL